MADKAYTVTGNKDIQLLIEQYDLTYTQARRYQMKKDGMSYSQIAEAESATIGAVQYSINLAKDKIGGVWFAEKKH